MGRDYNCCHVKMNNSIKPQVLLMQLLFSCVPITLQSPSLFVHQIM
uniref:Uncharacterized protein n=1 Tax=Arundo donax TaxID=35708 RepID=A0A0A9CBH6_ARUDO